MTLNVKQIHEYEQLTNKLNALRPDLEGDIVIMEVSSISKSIVHSYIDTLKYCIKLAAENKPMPWEGK